MVINVAPLLKQPLGTRLDLAVAESPIDPRGDNAGLLDASIVDIDSTLHLTHTNPGPFLEGAADADFAEQYYATIPVDSGVAVMAAPPDAKTIGSDFNIDLTPLLLEELILATPLAPLCREDCAGLCPVCGEDRNLRPHAHDETVDARWSALQGLRDLAKE